MTAKQIQWGEVHPVPSESVYNAIFVIVMVIGNDHFKAVGTGFITGMTNTGAGAVSAAHVFDEIYREQYPSEPRPSTPFTKEKAQRINLSPDNVFAYLFDQDRVHKLRLSELFYDHGSDTAWFQVRKQKPDSRKIFRHNFRLDADMAELGDEVEGIGFKGLEFKGEMEGPLLYATLRDGLTRRYGTVTEVLERTIKLKGPGAHVSFPIFGGMSGGPALKLNTGRDPAAFAILSSDWNDPLEQKNDVYTAGTTTISKLPLEWTTDPEGVRISRILFLSRDEGRGT